MPRPRCEAIKRSGSSEIVLNSTPTAKKNSSFKRKSEDHGATLKNGSAFERTTETAPSLQGSQDGCRVQSENIKRIANEYISEPIYSVELVVTCHRQKQNRRRSSLVH